MAKTTVSELQVLISANATAFQAQLDAVKKQMVSMGTISNKTSGKLGAGLKSTALRYIGLGAAITGAFKAMKAASNYIEDENLFAVSMRNAADETRAWSDQVERSVGVSGAWLRKYTGIMTNMSASMGLSHKEASKLGKNVALLSQDLASFYNISPEAAFEKMQSAMAGMPRPLQDLGIMVRDQELQQTALALGIRKTNGEFTAAQKALLTYETVIRATKNAQGDLSRTLNTPANQMRMLATNARNLGVAIGTMFQPLLSVALPVLNAIVMAATSAMRALAGLFGIEFKAEASAIGNVEAGVGGIGEAVDKAGGKIKKLKGQLASFDEINTIQEQDSGGGSGGGGGGAGSLPQIDWGKYNAGLDGVKNKAVAIAEAIKKAFKDFGKGFNFDKIGNAFKSFFNDANKFLKPIGKILGDLWGYFKPFIYWTANDLLPAFLNALGGAINFVGAVIGRVWDSFLKPFIDAFLVPIASFTGGVIVWVLNAIGDGLRWIAEQSGATHTVVSLMEAFALYHLIANAKLYLESFMTALTIARQGVPAAYAAFEAGSGIFASLGARIGSIISILGQLKSILLSALSAVFSPVGVAIGGLTAIFLGFNMAITQASISAERQKIAEENRMTVTKMSKRDQQNLNDSIAETKRLMNELSELELSAEEAELRWMGLVERSKLARDKYNTALKNGGLSTEELRKLQLEASIAEKRAEQAKNNLSEAQGKVTKNLKQTEDQQWKTIMSQEEARLVAILQKGEYNKLSEELQKLAKKEVVYTEGRLKGNKMAKEDTKAMAEFIGDRMAKIAEGNGKAWKSIWETAKSNVDNLKTLKPKVFEDAQNAGNDFGNGLVKGINNKRWEVYTAGYSLGKSAVQGHRDATGTRSPSKVMIKQGGFFTQGLTIGLQRTMGQVSRQASKIADDMVSQFRGVNINADSLSSHIDSASIGAIPFREKDADKAISRLISTGREPEPIHLTVKIGEENLVDKIINGINDVSFLKNRNVIDI